MNGQSTNNDIHDQTKGRDGTMNKNNWIILIVAICSILCFTSVDLHAFSEGYVLTGSYGGTTTVLLDSTGKTIHSWDHRSLANPKNGYSCYLLKNGNLLRSAIVPDGTAHSSMSPAQGIIQEIDPKGKIVWSFTFASTDSGMTHHDMKPMSNGHILAVVFVPLTKEKMKASGIDTSLIPRMSSTKFLLSEKIIEIDPKAEGGAKIVWEWKIHDHVIPDAQAAEHPELISGSIVKQAFYGNQWVHLNGLDYNEKLDMIIFSSRVFSECFIIDHGTTIQEAAGHTGGKRGKGGDILYRWGNPANYKASGATKLNVLHCVNWIPEGYPGEGNIIFFHNNASSSGGNKSFSQVVEIKLPMNTDGSFTKSSGQPFSPTAPTWLFAPTENFSSPAMSSAFRLPNGNTLTHLAYPSSGDGSTNMNTASQLLEVDKDQNILWKSTIDIDSRSTPTPGMSSNFNPAKIMYYNNNYQGVKSLLSGVSTKKAITNSRTQPLLYRTSGKIVISDINASDVSIFDVQGKIYGSFVPTGNSISIDTYTFSPGIYYVKIISKDGSSAVSSFNFTR
ncbi:MAG TPA: aryl-sulfate sulfotransferase [Chitinispirillaceae bacterium]|nr:aryl-sulfate sulfotransferase [Chitinispirillaceae bacterium]